MATKQLNANQCVPLHFLYGPQNCCLCNAQLELRQFKDMAISDIEKLLALLPEYSHTRKLLEERYGLARHKVEIESGNNIASVKSR